MCGFASLSASSEASQSSWLAERLVGFPFNQGQLARWPPLANINIKQNLKNKEPSTGSERS